MRNLRDIHGQSLAETALLMPLVLLTLVGLFQLMFLIFTQIKLQQSASQLAYKSSVHASRVELTTDITQAGQNQPWGIIDTMNSHFRKSQIDGWQSYPGISTLDSPGMLTTVDLQFRFYACFLFRWVHSVSSHSELPLEPQAPGDTA